MTLQGSLTNFKLTMDDVHKSFVKTLICASLLLLLSWMIAVFFKLKVTDGLAHEDHRILLRV